MNPIFKAAAAATTDGWLLGVMTLFFIAVFVGFFIWAYAPWRRDAMYAASMLPFDDDSTGGTR